MSDLKGKKPAELRDIANGLGIIGRYQMSKDQLIEAIETTLAEKAAKAEEAPKTEAKKETDPIKIADANVADARQKLKESRAKLIGVKDAEKVQGIRDEILAAENVLKQMKKIRTEVKKAIKQAAKENRTWSWKVFFGYLTAAGIGVALPIGVSVLMDSVKASSNEETNGDDL